MRKSPSQFPNFEPDPVISVLADWMKRDPEATAGYLLTRLDDVSEMTVELILRRWGEEDPGGASAFRERHKEVLPEGEE